jgi:hypothetical protein
MPRTTSFVMSLETLYAVKIPTQPGNWQAPQNFSAAVNVWPVFFKIDGSTAQVTEAGKLVGTATVNGFDGVGAQTVLQPGSSVSVPAEVSRHSDQVMAIPLPPNLATLLGRSDVGGVFGVAVVLVEPGGLESDALVAGHIAFNDSMQAALNDLIANLPELSTVDSSQIDPLVKEVSGAIHDAVKGAMGFWDTVDGFFNAPSFGSSFAHFSQDSLPVGALDQLDFDPASGNGPAQFSWSGAPVGFGGAVLNGAVGRSRRTVGQALLHRTGASVTAVAGYTSPDGYQHAIAAGDDGAVTEMYWQGPGQVGVGVLHHFSHRVVGLAGYATTDNYQHVIVGTDDGTLTEIYWQGSDSPQQGTLMHADRKIVAIAGYMSSDGYQRVIVGTDDGFLTEAYWQSGAVARNTLGQVPGHLVDLAAYESDGVHHVLVACSDGSLTELTWSSGASASTTPFAQVASDPWGQLLGVGAYQSSGERHVIVALSSGTLREFHAPTAAVGQQAIQLEHTDLTVIQGIVPIIDAYAERSGEQHAIAATGDGGVHEAWWQPSRIANVNPGGFHPVRTL